LVSGHNEKRQTLVDVGIKKERGGFNSSEPVGGVGGNRKLLLGGGTHLKGRATARWVGGQPVGGGKETAKATQRGLRGRKGCEAGGFANSGMRGGEASREKSMTMRGKGS